MKRTGRATSAHGAREGTCRVAGLPVLCVIGILDRERRVAQTVHVDVSVTVRLTGDAAADAEARDAAVGFATWFPPLATRVLAEGRFRLVETAIAALAAVLDVTLPLRCASARHYKLTITKGEALGGDGYPQLSWESPVKPGKGQGKSALGGKKTPGGKADEGREGLTAAPLFVSPEARLDWPDPRHDWDGLRVASASASGR